MAGQFIPARQLLLLQAGKSAAQFAQGVARFSEQIAAAGLIFQGQRKVDFPGVLDQRVEHLVLGPSEIGKPIHHHQAKRGQQPRPLFLQQCVGGPSPAFKSDNPWRWNSFRSLQSPAVPMAGMRSAQRPGEDVRARSPGVLAR